MSASFNSKTSVSDVTPEHHVDGSLAAETSMVLLDAMELVIQIVSNSDLYAQVLPQVLKVLLTSLGLNQSTSVLVNMLATQRSLVTKVSAHVTHASSL